MVLIRGILRSTVHGLWIVLFPFLLTVEQGSQWEMFRAYTEDNAVQVTVNKLGRFYKFTS